MSPWGIQANSLLGENGATGNMKRAQQSVCPVARNGVKGGA